MKLLNINLIFVVLIFLSGCLAKVSEIDEKHTPLLTTPGNFSITSVIAKNGQVELSWSKPDLALSYAVTYGTSAGDKSNIVSNCTTSTTCIIAGLTNATKYYFNVSAINAAGTKASSEVSATPIGAFTISSATTGANKVTLAWASASGASAYTVKYGTTSGSYTSTFSTNATSPFAVTGLSSSQVYYFMVIAHNSDNGSQAATLEVSQTTATSSTTPTLSASSTLGSISLSWNASTGSAPITYSVKRATASGGSFSTLATGISTLNYTDTSASDGVMYFYKVYSSNSGGDSNDSNEVSAASLGAFTISSAVGTLGQIEVTWSASPGATSYTVKYGTTSGSYPTTATTNATSPYVITGLANDTTYFVMVTATNATGTATASSEASAATSSLPSNPSSLAASNNTASQVNLTWVASATGSVPITYSVYRSSTSGSGYASIATGLSTTSYSDTSAVPGTNYYYVVKASNVAGPSGYSNEAIGRPMGNFSLTTAASSSNQIILSWASAAGASAYTVKYGTTSGSYPTTASTNATSPYSITGLTAGTTYYVMVTANNVSGSVNANSELSGVPLSAFAISSATATSNQVVLSWAASTGATSYTVKYGTTSGSYLTTASTNATSPLTISSLTNGTTYYFMVSAVNANGSINANAELSSMPIAPPLTPTGLTAIGATANIQLNWTATSGLGTITYNILRSTTSGSGYSTLATGQSGTTYSDLTALNGVTYYYVVSATNEGGSSPNSAEATATAMGSFSISAINSNTASSLEITWGASTGATTYTVKYGTTSGAYPTTATTNATSPYSISGLTAGTTYYVMVTANNTNGSVNATSEISGKPMSAFVISSTSASNGQVVLTWAASTGSTSYTVKHGTTSGSYPTTVSTNATSPLTISSLTNGTTYYFMVIANNANGALNATSETSATPLGSFSISSINSNTASALQVAWGSSTGASAYTVKYGTTSGSYPTIASTNATSPYTISGLTAGTTYYVMVTATNTNSSLNASSETTAIPIAAFTISSLTPGSGNISATWASSAGTTTYDILYDTVSHALAGSYASSSTNKVSGNSVTLANGTTYYFRIRANNSYGSVLSTNELSATSYQTFTLDVPYDVGSEASYVLSNSSAIEFVSGLARLAAIDQTDSDGTSSGFLVTHSGTTWDSTNNYVRLNTSLNNAELDPSWTPQYSKLLRYWKLDESSGTSFTDAISGTTTTATGTITYNSGKIGNSIGFDGSTGYISAGTMGTFGATLGSGFSISAWIKTTSTTYVTIFGTTSTGTKMNFQASINQSCVGGSYTAGAIRFYLRDNTGVEFCHHIITNTRVNDGNWHLLTYSINPSTKAMAFYLDGVNQTLVKSFDNSASTFVNFEFPAFIGAVNNRGAAASYLQGSIDELSVWSTPLTAAEVNIIYSRQMAKYAGIFTSRVIDGFGTQSWTSLENTTTLPFSKELPGLSGSEASTNYSSMSASLMTNLVGLWHLNETSGTSITDYSGNTNTATMQGTGTLAQAGIFGNAAKLDGATGYFSTTTLFSTPLNYSIQAWFKTSTLSGGVLLSFEDLQTGASSTFGRKIYMTNAGLLTYGIYTTSRIYATSAQAYNDGQWHHVIATQSSTAGMALYVDGNLVATGGGTAPQSTNGYWRFGHGTMSSSWTGYPTSNYFDAAMDEVAIWGRTLSAAEVLKVYRRGANRIKFQIRTCSTDTCSDQEALTTTGKGWKGPDNTQFSYFSELYNTTSNVLAGAVSTGSPTMTFSNFSGTNLSVTNNRYFQYRSILESDDKNTLCDYGAGATTCSPELKSVVVGPAHYDSSDPTITSKASIGSLYQQLDASGFTETLGGGSCTGARYTISGNGATFYYYNGSSWAASSDTYATATSAATIASNLSTLVATMGTGTLQIKTFLHSDGVTACEVNNVRMTGLKN